MLKVLPASRTPVYTMGPFRIRRIRPSLTFDQAARDPAVGPLSVVDHATLEVGTRVALHEHRNDEIFSYLWRGLMVHEDSAGQRVELTPRRLMMMNAGSGFFHEESTPSERVEMLQIFVRPREADLEPRVQFYERPEPFTDGAWHLLAGPEGSGAPLEVRNEVRVYDAHPEAGAELAAPAVPGLQSWLYVMDGEVVCGDTALSKGDAFADAGAPLPPLRAVTGATIVAFLTDRTAPASLAGTISGFRG